MALKHPVFMQRGIKKKRSMLIECRDLGLVALDYQITFHILNDLKLEWLVFSGELDRSTGQRKGFS